MSLVEDLKQASKDGKVKQARREVPEYPKGWEPSVEENGDGTAVAVSAPLANQVDLDSSAEEAELIREFGLDPSQWDVVGRVSCRRGQNSAGEWRFSYRADLARKDISSSDDLSELIQEIKKYKKKKTTPPTGESAFAVFLADLQMGKPDGYGVEGTVRRFLKVIDEVEERVAELRKIGRPIGTLYVFGMGDLVEGCDGHYAQQTFRVELNRRDQVKVVRRLILKALQRWADLFDKVVVACVGGNHGEHRKNGKSFTDFADNDDVAIFEQIAEVLSANPDRYGHVHFVIPDDELAVTLDVCGTITTITHGHVGRAGATAQAKQVNWWKNQAHGQQPAGDSTLLVTAHYHHFTMAQHGTKTHIQCPALEDRSDWFVDISGQDAPPGALTMIIGGGSYSDIQVLNGNQDV